MSLDVMTVRTAANGLQWRIRTYDLVGRLTSAARGASPEEAQRLDALRERLVAAQAENYGILTRQWPVDPTRGCQYPQLMLGSAMQAAEGAEKRSLLGQARDDAQKCVEKAELAIGLLSRSSDVLSKAVDESVGALPWPASAPAGAAPGAASSVPAATGPVASPDAPASARKE